MKIFVKISTILTLRSNTNGEKSLYLVSDLIQIGTPTYHRVGM